MLSRVSLKLFKMAFSAEKKVGYQVRLKSIRLITNSFICRAAVESAPLASS